MGKNLARNWHRRICESSHPGYLWSSWARPFSTAPSPWSPKAEKKSIPPFCHNRFTPWLAMSTKTAAADAIFCPVLEHAEDDLAKAREDALVFAGNNPLGRIAQAAKHITSLDPGGSHARGSPAICDWPICDSAQRRADRALALAAGLEIVAESDSSEVVVGEPFTVDAECPLQERSWLRTGKVGVSRCRRKPRK